MEISSSSLFAFYMPSQAYLEYNPNSNLKLSSTIIRAQMRKNFIEL
jgi:hypothetical protein